MRRYTLRSLLIVLIVIAGVVAVAVPRPVDWKGFLEHQDSMRARLALETGERIPLIGPAVDGNAWEDYGTAVLLRHTWRLGFIIGDRTEARESREHHIPLAIVECVQRGSRQRRAFDSRSALRSIGQYEEPVISVGLNEARETLVRTTHVHCEAGDRAAAIRLTLATLQFGHDVASEWSLATDGLVLLHDGLHLALELLQDEGLTREELRQLLTALELLDRQFFSLADLVERRSFDLCEAELVQERSTPDRQRRRRLAHARPYVEQFVAAIRMGESEPFEASDVRLDTSTRSARDASVESPAFEMADNLPAWRRGALSHLRVAQAVARVRLGHQPGADHWPRDPATLGLLLVGNEGVIRGEPLPNSCRAEARVKIR